MTDLRSELMKVREQYGSLTPVNVVKAAEPEDSPLHSRFEWDDTEAARKYRLDQARGLIRIVREPYTRPSGEMASVRAFHSLPQADEERAYQPLDEIVQNEVAIQVLLRQAEREFRTLMTKYGHLKEFIEMARKQLGEEAA